MRRRRWRRIRTMMMMMDGTMMMTYLGYFC
jgi:hypothetical protein